MDTRTLTRLARILALLGSDQPGERAAAGLAADRLLAALHTSWHDLLLRPATSGAARRPSYGVDEKGAAEARMRQLRATNEGLEKQVRSLRRRLAILQEVERRRVAAGAEADEPD